METNFNKKLGYRIRELREACGLKQGVLADKLNMERSNLTRIENGKQRPNDDNLEKIAQILNVEIKDLFDFGHKKPKDELIDLINIMLNEMSKKEVEYCYKTLQNLKQLK
ncbi:helix-turn-helix transcriptional regulator [bacterium]|nr:helix-turn-helix transcriptional regulator [bacterium]